MNRRKMLFLSMLLAAGGGPYLFFSNGVSYLQQQWSNLVAPRDSGTMLSLSESPVATTQPNVQSIGMIRDTQAPPVTDLAQALNFNITAESVVNHWPRVTTSLANMELSGLRVPLVTGTNLNDVHGSLSYYFDQQHILQRITFQGSTGDPAKIVGIVTQYHGFQTAKSLTAGLYLKRWNGKPTGVLSITHAPLVQANDRNSRYSVTLEINRTNGKYRLSEEMGQYLAHSKQAGRW